MLIVLKYGWFWWIMNLWIGCRFLNLMAIAFCVDKFWLPWWVPSTNWGILWSNICYHCREHTSKDYYFHLIQVQHQNLWPLWTPPWRRHTFQKWHWKDNGFLEKISHVSWSSWSICGLHNLTQDYLTIYIIVDKYFNLEIMIHFRQCLNWTSWTTGLALKLWNCIFCVACWLWTQEKWHTQQNPNMFSIPKEISHLGKLTSTYT
jgi:hypothetical protein